MPKYELPDHTVSLVWSERSRNDGSFVRYSRALRAWFTSCNTETTPHKGDWLPWTPPVFPPKVKLKRRRCWATVDGRRELLFQTDVGFYCDRTEEYRSLTAVTGIDWLDPEFIDELPPDPRGVK